MATETEQRDEDDLLARTAALIREYQEGDEGAFRQLYELHSQPVLRSVARSLGRHLREFVDPEDILQETFRLAYVEVQKRSWEDFRTAGRFRLLLAKIARQVVSDTGRKAGAQKRDWRRREDLGRELVGQGPRPSEIVLGAELTEKAEDAFLTLSDSEREILDLRDNLGLEYTEIAGLLDVRTPEAAKLRCSRARRRWEERTRDLLA